MIALGVSVRSAECIDLPLISTPLFQVDVTEGVRFVLGGTVFLDPMRLLSPSRTGDNVFFNFCVGDDDDDDNDDDDDEEEEDDDDEEEDVATVSDANSEGDTDCFSGISSHFLCSKFSSMERWRLP